jgi:hypothetical protein
MNNQTKITTNKEHLFDKKLTDFFFLVVTARESR